MSWNMGRAYSRCKKSLTKLCYNRYMLKTCDLKPPTPTPFFPAKQSPSSYILENPRLDLFQDLIDLFPQPPPRLRSLFRAHKRRWPVIY